jgi:hypothetical protein
MLDDEGFLPYLPKDFDLMAELYLPGRPEVGDFSVKIRVLTCITVCSILGFLLFLFFILLFLGLCMVLLHKISNRDLLYLILQDMCLLRL